MPLNAAQHEQMSTKGFIVLENFFDAETMATVDANLSEYHKAHEERLKAEGGVAGISRAGEILFSDHIAEQSDSIKAFVTRPEFAKLTSELLGPDVDLYWNQTVYKNPESTKEFPWHQDDAYTPVNHSPYLTLWLAISDATEENGCISVLPGSHIGGLRPHAGSDIGLVGYPSDAPDQGIKVPISSGSMIAFWSTVLHKSGPNLSTGMRKAYVIQYCKTGLRWIAGDHLVENLIPVVRNGQSV